MSLMSMRRKMAGQKSAAIIIWVLIIVFTAGIVAMVIPNLRGGNDSSLYKGMPPSNTGTAIATVNGDKITSEQLDFLYNQLGEKVTLDNAISARQQCFDQLVLDNIYTQVKKELKIIILPWDVKNYAKSWIGSQLDTLRDQCDAQAKSAAETAKKDPKAEKPKTGEELYYEQLKAVCDNIPAMKDIDYKDRNAFINGYIKFLLSDTENNAQTELTQLAETSKLGKKLGAKLEVNPFDEKFAEKYNTKEVKASWIFIAAKENTTASLEEAKKKAEEVRSAAIKDPKSFNKLAADNSDDMMIKFMAQKGQEGSLGWVSPTTSQMVAPMAVYMCYSTNKGEISPSMLITNQSFYGPPQVGYAFVIVEDVRDAKDKVADWSKVAKVKTEATANQFASVIGNNYIQYKKAIATIERISPELKYYDITYSNPKEANNILKTLINDTTFAGVLSAAFKVVYVKTVTDLKEKATLYEGILQYAGQDSAKYNLELGKVYLALGKKAQAKEQFEYALMGSANTDQDQSIHKELLVQYKALNDSAKIAEINKWLKEHPVEKTNNSGMPIQVSP